MDETRIWLENNPQNKLLFIIDEAICTEVQPEARFHILLRRLFNRLGIGRDRIQFVLTTASMRTEDLKTMRRFSVL